MRVSHTRRLPPSGRGTAPLNSLPLRLARVVALFLAFGAVAAVAQPAGTGSISGRILNPATGEYVRNVEVSVRGTTLTTVSADDGSYRITGVPAGEAVVVVNYTGYA